ncbi:MAG: PASTA domain-containing protein [Ignavibacteriaceae bacterium]
MKNYLKNPRTKKILYYLGGFFVFILIMNYIVMPWYVSEPEKPVPKVLGLKEANAINILKDADLAPIVGDTTYDEKYPRGSVIYQRPNAGEIVKVGRRIYLFISGGEPSVSVPMLKGKSIRDAKFSLERLGLNLGKVDSVASSNPKDMIFDQQFAAGTPLKKGDYVGISLSIGENAGGILVPNLIGKSLSEAEKILADSTLKVGKINYQPSVSLLPNTVLDQYPSGGNKVTAGASIDLFLTKPADTDNGH